MRVHASSAARRAAPPATASRVAVRRAASPLAARRSETSRGALADPSSRLPRLRRASSRRASSSRDGRRRAATTTTSPTRAMFDPDAVDDPLLRKAMKEPVAFFGGLFAGFLGLRVDEAGSPLKAWVDAAAEDAGVRDVEGGVVVEDAANTEGAAEETSAGDGESLAGEDGRGKDGETTTGGELEA